MASAQAQVQQTPASDYDRAVAWQNRSIEIAERDQLVATRTNYGRTAEFFHVPSRSHPKRFHLVTLYNSSDPRHANQIHCPCEAQAHGLPCGHAGAVLRLLDYERANLATWQDATTGYQDEM